MDDIVINKSANIERCVRRIREVHAGDPASLTNDITRQDSILLNLQRACEATIDLAMHMVRTHALGVPQDSRSAFELLRDAGIIDEALCSGLQKMVGFRNIAVHEYTRLDLDIVASIIEKSLPDFSRFTKVALTRMN